MLYLKAFSCNSFAVEEEEELDFLSFFFCSYGIFMVSSHAAFESFQLQQFCSGRRGEGIRLSFFLSFCVPIASSWYHPMLHLQALDWNISFAVDIREGGGDEDRIRKTQPALKP
jgi:hypothetical protein